MDYIAAVKRSMKVIRARFKKIKPNLFLFCLRVFKLPVASNFGDSGEIHVRGLPRGDASRGKVPNISNFRCLHFVTRLRVSLISPESPKLETTRSAARL